MNSDAIETFDTVVVGGGPAGATAATDLARRGYAVLLLDREGRIKPCGGAIPPKLIDEFDIPEALLVAKARAARIVSPTGRRAEMPIDGGYVGMVDRATFDEWLRDRAERSGATRRNAAYQRVTRDADGSLLVHYRMRHEVEGEAEAIVRARTLIGADGAVSAVARQCVDSGERRYVYAYHEIVRSPGAGFGDFDGARCDVHYRGSISPDFYGWVFPHGDTSSIGVGTAMRGFSLRGAVESLRADCGLAGRETIRREGAPIPMQPLARWDNARDVVLAGDAAGVVAPASGEGIYYAMVGGRLAAEAVEQCLASGDARALAQARRRFMRMHGRVFWVLGMMQRFWYANDTRRERFVTMCRDRDVQRLTWESYMYKKISRARPMAHVRIFFKDLAHLCGIVAP